MAEKAQHILVGSNLSEQADIAVREAVRLAAHHKATLTVLHAAESEPGDEEEARLIDALAERIDKEVADLGVDKDDFEALRFEITTGKPADALMTYADGHAVGLIVVGKSKQSMMKRMLVGSSAEALIKSARQMVLVCRVDKVPGFQRILVPMDFSAPAKRALEMAAGIGGGEGSELHALHIDEYGEGSRGAPVGMSGETPAFNRSTQKQALADLRELAEKLPGKPEVEIAQRVGSPIDKTVEYAERADCDLIVVGYEKSGGLGNIFGGSPAIKIARAAHCSVLVVH